MKTKEQVLEDYIRSLVENRMNLELQIIQLRAELEAKQAPETAQAQEQANAPKPNGHAEAESHVSH